MVAGRRCEAAPRHASIRSSCKTSRVNARRARMVTRGTKASQENKSAGEFTTSVRIRSRMMKEIRDAVEWQLAWWMTLDHRTGDLNRKPKG
jgi:hypothetical protein